MADNEPTEKAAESEKATEKVPANGKGKVHTYRAKVAAEYPLGTIVSEGGIVTTAEKMPEHAWEKV